MKRKQVVYRCNGDAKTDEVEVDRDGEISVPNQGDVLVRKGKNWKVAAIMTEMSVTDPQQYPVVRVFLGDNFWQSKIADLPKSL